MADATAYSQQLEDIAKSLHLIQEGQDALRSAKLALQEQELDQQEANASIGLSGPELDKVKAHYDYLRESARAQYDIDDAATKLQEKKTKLSEDQSTLQQKALKEGISETDVQTQIYYRNYYAHQANLLGVSTAPLDSERPLNPATGQPIIVPGQVSSGDFQMQKLKERLKQLKAQREQHAETPGEDTAFLDVDTRKIDFVQQQIGVLTQYQDANKKVSAALEERGKITKDLQDTQATGSAQIQDDIDQIAAAQIKLTAVGITPGVDLFKYQAKVRDINAGEDKKGSQEADAKTKASLQNAIGQVEAKASTLSGGVGKEMLDALHRTLDLFKGKTDETSQLAELAAVMADLTANYAAVIPKLKADVSKALRNTSSIKNISA
jgi:hypothetical protein